MTISVSTNEQFTAIGDAVVEQAIANTVRQLADDVRQLANADNVAVYLGGGYGRGEGGVLVTQDNRHLPYNDLDFFVFSQKLSSGKRAVFNQSLQAIATKYEEKTGVPLDFAPPKPIQKLRKEQHTLMYQELLYSHRLVCGPDLLADIPCSDAHTIPILEGLRLLVNRGMGLLFAAQKMSTDATAPATIDFAVRNLHKSAMGAGDALLIAQHRYDYNLDRRLKIILYDSHVKSIFTNLAPLYQAAYDFKIQPSTSSMDPLAQLPMYLDRWLEAARNFVAITTDRSASILETTNQLSACVFRHPSFIGRSPLLNALRWIAKTKSAFPLPQLFKNATTRLFVMLHESLLEIHDRFVKQQASLAQITAENNERHQELTRLWQIFN